MNLRLLLLRTSDRVIPRLAIYLALWMLGGICVQPWHGTEEGMERLAGFIVTPLLTAIGLVTLTGVRDNAISFTFLCAIISLGIAHALTTIFWSRGRLFFGLVAIMAVALILGGWGGLRFLRECNASS